MTPTDDSQPSPAAGWYLDPGGSGGLRYWDGASWTGHLAPPGPPAVAVSPGVVSFAPSPVSVVAKAKTPTWVWVLAAVIVLLLGSSLVAAVAVPTVRTVRNAVWDEEAKTSLFDAQSAVSVARREDFDASSATPERLELIEPSLTFTAGPSGGPSTVSVYAVGRRVTLALRSRSGTCFAMVDDGPEGSDANPSGYTTGRLGRNSPCGAATATGFREESF